MMGRAYDPLQQARAHYRQGYAEGRREALEEVRKALVHAESLGDLSIWLAEEAERREGGGDDPGYQQRRVDHGMPETRSEGGGDAD